MMWGRRPIPELGNVGSGFRAGSNIFPNPLLVSKLDERFKSQQFFCDTVTSVHTHPPEAV